MTILPPDRDRIIQPEASHLLHVVPKVKLWQAHEGPCPGLSCAGKTAQLMLFYCCGRRGLERPEIRAQSTLQIRLAKTLSTLTGREIFKHMDTSFKARMLLQTSQPMRALPPAPTESNSDAKSASLAKAAISSSVGPPACALRVFMPSTRKRLENGRRVVSRMGALAQGGCLRHALAHQLACFRSKQVKCSPASAEAVGSGNGFLQAGPCTGLRSACLHGCSVAEACRHKAAALPSPKSKPALSQNACRFLRLPLWCFRQRATVQPRLGWTKTLFPGRTPATCSGHRAYGGFLRASSSKTRPDTCASLPLSTPTMASERIRRAKSGPTLPALWAARMRRRFGPQRASRPGLREKRRTPSKDPKVLEAVHGISGCGSKPMVPFWDR